MLASYPGAQGGGERAPGTHCSLMRLISQISGKIVYFSNLPCYVPSTFSERLGTRPRLVASYPGAQGGEERAPGTHCLRMRLISQISGKIVYFSYLPCYVDIIIN